MPQQWKVVRARGELNLAAEGARADPRASQNIVGRDFLPRGSKCSLSCARLEILADRCTVPQLVSSRVARSSSSSSTDPRRTLASPRMVSDTTARHFDLADEYGPPTGEAGSEPTSDKASNQDEWGEFVSSMEAGRSRLRELINVQSSSFTALERSSSTSTRSETRLSPTPS